MNDKALRRQIADAIGRLGLDEVSRLLRLNKIPLMAVASGANVRPSTLELARANAYRLERQDA